MLKILDVCEEDELFVRTQTAAKENVFPFLVFPFKEFHSNNAPYHKP